MISSQEFQRTLQAGKIHEALTLLLRDAAEIDVTTRIAADSNSSEVNRNGYLRTKINLLTGEVQNEIGKGVITDSNSYLKLQKLHIEQIVATDRIVQAYWHQLKTILGVLSTTAPESDRAPTNSLVAERLAQATLLLKQEIVPESPVRSSPPVQPSTPTPSSSMFESIDDDDLDLSIESEGEVWEEWIEDEDFSSGSMLPPMLTIADRSANLVNRHLNSLDVKPTAPRTNSTLVTSPPRWDKFAPDYIDLDPQPRSTKNRN